jgi:chitodextrinase
MHVRVLIGSSLLFFACSVGEIGGPSANNIQTSNTEPTSTNPSNSNTSSTSNNVNNVLLTDVVASFEFEDGSGTTVKDGSGNGNDATLIGGQFADGMVGKAARTDGVDDYLTVAHRPSLALTQLTASAWVKPSAFTTASPSANVISKGTNEDAPGAYGVMVNGSGQVVAVLNTGSAAYLTGPKLDTTRWHHVAITYDGATFRLYVNGAEAGSKALNTPLPANSEAVVLAGRPGAGFFYSGLVDSVQLYKRALAPAEVMSIFSAAMGPDTQAPTAPANLAAVPQSGTSVRLTWSASTDNVQVAGYKVFRNGMEVSTTASLTYLDSGLAVSTSYNYQVSAYDPAQNQSPKSTAASATTTNGANIPIPELATWEAHMTEFGQKNCDYLNGGATGDQKLAATYYDAERVFFNIADYTSDSKWLSCAQAAESSYRGYVLSNNGGVPGYWNFARGLYEDYVRNGDSASRDAVIGLSTHTFCADTTPADWTAGEASSREVAYCIDSLIYAEKVGAPNRARLDFLLDQALGHVDQWTGPGSPANFAPFMFGLTAEALILYYEEVSPDPRILPAIEKGLNYIWAQAWLPADECFWYRRDDAAPGDDLNMLIAPAYAWAWKQTGNDTYRDRGDLVFAGGVKRAYLANGKQFNQSYRWSFEFVRLRK